MTDKKIIFIIVGIVGVIVAIPIVLMLIGMIAGFIFYRSGGN
ncbi:MAG TPA: hypothetical protein PKY82_02860 [Pyrinomonadaceae bacterium]|nr:hypothetical protein [Pyrinomonadaceae bacterium]